MDNFTINGNIESFDVIVIGHLKYNPYFGESADAPPRGDPSTCTSTIIRGFDGDGKRYSMIVDPTLRSSAEDYYFDVNRRTGLKPEDITHCFITHEHFDHYEGVKYFPNARWLAAKPVADRLDGIINVTAVEGEFLPGVRAIALPGHTSSLHGIAFIHYRLSCLIAADAVMTKDHFKHETTMFEENTELACDTVRGIKRTFDLVIPGHGNVILNVERLR